MMMRSGNQKPLCIMLLFWILLLDGVSGSEARIRSSKQRRMELFEVIPDDTFSEEELARSLMGAAFSVEYSLSYSMSLSLEVVSPTVAPTTHPTGAAPTTKKGTKFAKFHKSRPYRPPSLAPTSSTIMDNAAPGSSTPTATIDTLVPTTAEQEASEEPAPKHSWLFLLLRFFRRVRDFFSRPFSRP
eukprot:Nitzschia sp. Nitz4//scaffold294_size23022//19994//20638//NITZ4_008516-RA/size23022-augustus-gene-0.18-mRNA-1//1//CDS//3329546229//2402//frame0